MASVNYEVFYDEVLPDVHSVPLPVALRAVRNAAIEFCDRSHVWDVDHAEIAVSAADSTYDLAPPAETVVAKITQAWFEGNPLDPTTPGELHNEFGEWTAITGTPTRYLQRSSGEVTLFPIPDADGALNLRMSLKPTRTSTGLESWIAEKYLEEIAHGAKARLFAVPKAEWSDGNLAVFHQNKFEAGVTDAVLDVEQGLVQSSLRISVTPI